MVHWPRRVAAISCRVTHHDPFVRLSRVSVGNSPNRRVVGQDGVLVGTELYTPRGMPGCRAMDAGRRHGVDPVLQGIQVLAEEEVSGTFFRRTVERILKAAQNPFAYLCPN